MASLSLVIVIVSVLLAVANRETPGVAGGGPALSVLDTAGPSLPPEVASRPDMQQRLADPSASRLAMSVRGKDIFVAKGHDNTICLLVVEQDSDRTTSGTCQDISVLGNRAILLVVSDAAGQTETIGVVANGFTSAHAAGQSAPVRNNAFALHDVQLQDVQVSGNGRTINADIRTP